MAFENVTDHKKEKTTHSPFPAVELNVKGTARGEDSKVLLFK